MKQKGLLHNTGWSNIYDYGAEGFTVYNIGWFIIYDYEAEGSTV